MSKISCEIVFIDRFLKTLEIHSILTWLTYYLGCEVPLGLW